jgi:hypothetical protein
VLLVFLLLSSQLHCRPVRLSLAAALDASSLPSSFTMAFVSNHPIAGVNLHSELVGDRDSHATQNQYARLREVACPIDWDDESLIITSIA